MFRQRVAGSRPGCEAHERFARLAGVEAPNDVGGATSHRQLRTDKRKARRVGGVGEAVLAGAFFSTGAGRGAGRQAGAVGVVKADDNGRCCRRTGGQAAGCRRFRDSSVLSACWRGSS